MMSRPMLCLLAALSGGLAVAAPSAGPADVDWPVYRGDPKANQFSPLAGIHAGNVHRLEPVWEYHTGDAAARGSTMYSNPLVIGDLMYFTTPALKAVALDPVTGREAWTFDPSPYHENQRVLRLRNRGVTFWQGEAGRRIFHFVKDRIFALDADTGRLITSFGENGIVDLRENLGRDPAEVSLEMTSPGAIYRNLLIVGSRVNESYNASPGHIRAYDTVTGEFKWIFHTIPRPGEFGHDTWEWVEGENYGGANAWGGITVDEQRGWVFCATGSPTEDFYGGFRKGMNLFGNCVLALDATTGERKWHYQTVHHDIWDYDNPSAPILVTLRTGRTARDAVVQLTKMGLTFVLDRDTGEPLFPVAEVPVPGSNVPGEEAWPTQPFPLKPAPLVRLNLTEADLTHITPEARARALQEFRRYRSGAIYTPPSLQGTLTTPGFFGGVEWHGASFDPQLNVLYVNANDASTLHVLRPVEDLPPDSQLPPAELGRKRYENSCIGCHGDQRAGVPPAIPGLRNVALDSAEIAAVIRQGRNAMPAFGQLRPAEVDALVAYVTSAPGEVRREEPAPAAVDRYTIGGYRVFKDVHGVPAIAPPWGTLNAIDLVSGETLWKVPLGEYPQLAAQGIRNTGTLNFGGAVATAGGVIFIAATADEKFRAFEKHSGRLLWEYQLPAGGYATPSVYRRDGRQYVVIAAGGGGKNGTPTGDSIIAFALPATEPEPAAPPSRADESGWISLFDGRTLDGWVHLNGSHTYTVEDGAIVGRTVKGSRNSFLCTTDEFGDFELELEVMVDRVTNQGIQIRSQARPVTVGEHYDFQAGRVYGPQVEIRRFYPGQPTTGVLYGEALGTGWLSAKEKWREGHRHFLDAGWNHLRIVAEGPRIRTWVNGHAVEDLVNEEVYATHPRGFIGLQIHGLNGRERGFAEHGLSVEVPLVMKWRNIRVRPLDAAK